VHLLSSICLRFLHPAGNAGSVLLYTCKCHLQNSEVALFLTDKGVLPILLSEKAPCKRLAEGVFWTWTRQDKRRKPDLLNVISIEHGIVSLPNWVYCHILTGATGRMIRFLLWSHEHAVGLCHKETGMDKIRPAELAFDIDGVIADTFRAFVNTARESYGVEIEYEAITDYDFKKVIDIDDETSDAIIERILEDPVGIGIAPVQGAVAVLRRLSGFGPLCLVTARTNREAIMEWVRQTLTFDNGDYIRLEATGTHEQKLPVLLRHGIRYFVEDRLETCYLIQKSPVTPIVFDQPWNRQAHPFLSVGSWDDIRDMVQWDAA
jgi:uncharacterized protein